MMIRRFFFLICILSGAGCLNAQTFYVNGATGNDANSSVQAQNPATPWATIQHAIDNAVPGCEIVVESGIYIEELNVGTSGTSAMPITLRADSCGGSVVSGDGQARTLLYMENVQHWVIECLVFKNAIGNNSTGIEITGTSADITVRDCEITAIQWNANAAAVPTASDNAYPFIVLGNTTTPITDIVIEGSNLHDNVTGFSETCAINGNVDGFEVKHNKVTQNSNIGIDAIGNEGTCPSPTLDKARNGRISFNTVSGNHGVYDSSAAGIYCDGADNIIIENNNCNDNDYGIEVGCEAPGRISSGFEVRNNLIWQNDKAGIVIGGYDGPVNTGTVKNVNVTGNTLYQNDLSFGDNGEVTMNYAENVTMRNNIFNAKGAVMLSQQCDDDPININFDYNQWNSGVADSSSSLWTWQGNLYTGLGAYRSATGQDSHSAFGFPEFVSATPAQPSDFQINASSPCLDAGDPLFNGQGQVDFFGGLRIWDCCVDRGCHEKGAPMQNGPGIFNAFEPLSVLFINAQTFELIPSPTTEILNVILFTAEGKNISLRQEGRVFTPVHSFEGVGILWVKTNQGIHVSKYFFSH